VEVGKVEVSFLPAVVLGEPSRRLGEEEETAEEDKTRDGLDAPCDAEGGGTIDADGAAVGDEVHDEDT
jgi:hypothetical protein